MYVDGFLVPVKRDRIEDYRKMAEMGAKAWMKHGALTYMEAMADDVPEGKITSFPKAVNLQADEVVFFSWITYPDKATRDACNAKVMQEMDSESMPAEWQTDPPMNMQRMIFGGFTAFVTEDAAG